MPLSIYAERKRVALAVDVDRPIARVWQRALARTVDLALAWALYTAIAFTSLSALWFYLQHRVLTSSFAYSLIYDAYQDAFSVLMKKGWVAAQDKALASVSNTIVLEVGLPVGLAFGVVFAGVIAVPLCYEWLAMAAFGNTPGRFICGLKVVRFVPRGRLLPDRQQKRIGCLRAGLRSFLGLPMLMAGLLLLSSSITAANLDGLSVLSVLGLLVGGACVAAAVWGPLFALYDGTGHRRTMRDRLSGTVVVSLERGKRAGAATATGAQHALGALPTVSLSPVRKSAGPAAHAAHNVVQTTASKGRKASQRVGMQLGQLRERLDERRQQSRTRRRG